MGRVHSKMLPANAPLDEWLMQFVSWLRADGPDVLRFDPDLTSLHVRAFASEAARQGLDLITLLGDASLLQEQLQRFGVQRQTLTDEMPKDLIFAETCIRLFAAFFESHRVAPPGATPTDTLTAARRISTP